MKREKSTTSHLVLGDVGAGDDLLVNEHGVELEVERAVLLDRLKHR